MSITLQSVAKTLQIILIGIKLYIKYIPISNI